MEVLGLASIANLTLAWRRITTGGNYPYKRFFRPVYTAYDLALEENLSDLRARLIGGSWMASRPEQVYIPKASGLQRPITLMRLEDQIVLQALANVLSTKLLERRRRLAFRSVFSNLQDEPKSIFFVKNWRETYKAFQKRVEGNYSRGRRWVVDFDLAAFYDTISHNLLVQTGFPRSHDSDDVRRITEWLAIWSSREPGSTKGHGLPQGPVASDYLAEVFMLPIDEAMTARFGYTRYVDDIRLFVKTEAAARRAMVRLEVLCRERGLIPQPGKVAIRKVSSIKDALGSLPSIHEPHGDEPTPRLTASRAQRLLGPAIAGRPARVVDKTRLRFVLFRADPSKWLLGKACQLLARHPEHIDAFAVHLTQYGYSKKLARCCIDVMRSTPYDYVAGEMWNFLARVQYQLKRKDPATWVSLFEEADAVLRTRSGGPTLQWGAGTFVSAASADGATGIRRALRAIDSSTGRALLGGDLAPPLFVPSGLAAQWMRSDEFEVGSSLSLRMHDLRITPAQLGLDSRRLKSQVRRTLKVLGLVRQPASQVDVMGELIAHRYGVDSAGEWRRLLGGEYAYALSLLHRADRAFDPARSDWLKHQNSFNQIMFLRLQAHLLSTARPGVVTVVARDGKLVDYGVTLEVSNQFSRTHPTIADVFRDMNTRRNRLPGSHPYEKRSHQRNHYLGKQERNRFVQRLTVAYRDLLLLC